MGRMAAPIQLPFAYEHAGRSGGAAHTASTVRVVQGDLMRVLPVSAYGGMESDYVESDAEEENHGLDM